MLLELGHIVVAALNRLLQIGRVYGILVSSKKRVLKCDGQVVYVFIDDDDDVWIGWKIKMILFYFFKKSLMDSRTGLQPDHKPQPPRIETILRVSTDQLMASEYKPRSGNTTYPLPSLFKGSHMTSFVLS